MRSTNRDAEKTVQPKWLGGGGGQGPITDKENHNICNLLTYRTFNHGGGWEDS